jgi:predicted nucleotidyltransferase
MLPNGGVWRISEGGFDPQMRASRFVALIGSQSRGDYDARSDCDVLVIGSAPPKLSTALEKEYGCKLSLVTYDWKTFHRLYKRGSLFLYHALTEGRLLEGDLSSWHKLRDNFSVQTDFRKELTQCLARIRLFEHPRAFGGHFLTPLVFAFTQVKNASIFFLAHKGIHIFNKSKAIRIAAHRVDFEEVKVCSA